MRGEGAGIGVVAAAGVGTRPPGGASCPGRNRPPAAALDGCHRGQGNDARRSVLASSASGIGIELTSACDGTKRTIAAQDRSSPAAAGRKVAGPCNRASTTAYGTRRARHCGPADRSRDAALQGSLVPAAVHHPRRLDHRLPDGGRHRRLARLRAHQQRAASRADRARPVPSAVLPDAAGRPDRRPAQPPHRAVVVLRRRLPLGRRPDVGRVAGPSHARRSSMRWSRSTWRRAPSSSR